MAEVGRPTKYSKETLEIANTYVNGGYEEEEVIPTIPGLALAIGIARSTVYEWAKEGDKEEFSDIVEDLLARQEMKLVKGGLTGEFNSNITKLNLTKHGYSDKQEIDAKGGFTITMPNDDASTL